MDMEPVTVEFWTLLAGLAGVLLTVGSNLWFCARWTGNIEGDIRREQTRIDQLFGRDERIFAELKEISSDLKSVTLWVEREKGRQEARTE